MMKIAVACDHAAINLKREILAYLTEKGYEPLDFGAYEPVPADYPDFARKAAQAVAGGEAQFGILICGTGIGMSMSANKVKGIRCALLSDTFSARATRAHNDANMMALGERVIGVGLALELVEVFLTTPFSHAERHQRRIDKIGLIEEEYFK